MKVWKVYLFPWHCHHPHQICGDWFCHRSIPLCVLQCLYNKLCTISHSIVNTTVFQENHNMILSISLVIYFIHFSNFDMSPSVRLYNNIFLTNVLNKYLTFLNLRSNKKNHTLEVFIFHIYTNTCNFQAKTFHFRRKPNFYFEPLVIIT